MIIHFVGSRADLEDQMQYLQPLLKCIKEKGHSLASDWLEQAVRQLVVEKRVPRTLDWPMMFKESVESISRADAVIAETSIPSFAVGYQVAQAVHMKKPTLVLNREGVERSFFASGIETGIDYQQYSLETLEDIVRKFLDDNDIQTKDMRFNFFIDRPIYNYLRWTSLKTGKTKAEILRELVEREIERGNN